MNKTDLMAVITANIEEANAAERSMRNNDPDGAVEAHVCASIY
jgi:hypothetical protein